VFFDGVTEPAQASTKTTKIKPLYIYMYRCTKPHRQQIITNKQNNKMFGKWVHF
jgi:hypothetical protein